MNGVLDGLKERFENAKARLLKAQQVSQAAQIELQAATNEHNIWNAAVQIEAREEAQRTAAAQASQIPMELAASIPGHSPKSTAAGEDHSEAATETEPVNKTDLVREVLRQHANGMTPTEVWKALQKQISSRAYLYSILKRLRDKDEVVIKRKKYVLKFKPLEVKSETETTLIQ